MKVKSILILWLLITVFFISASGQHTAEDWLDEGVDLAQQGKYDEAIQAYIWPSKSIYNTQKPGIIKALALNNQGKHDEAIQAYDRAIELDQQYALAWNNKGLALNDLGNTMKLSRLMRRS